MENIFQILLDTTAWPIYNQIYPLKSNGNLKGLDAFREPWKYLIASYSEYGVKVTISDFL